MTTFKTSIEEITALVNGLSIPGNVVTLCVIPAAS